MAKNSIQGMFKMNKAYCLKNVVTKSNNGYYMRFAVDAKDMDISDAENMEPHMEATIRMALNNMCMKTKLQTFLVMGAYCKLEMLHIETPNGFLNADPATVLKGLCYKLQCGAVYNETNMKGAKIPIELFFFLNFFKELEGETAEKSILMELQDQERLMAQKHNEYLARKQQAQQSSTPSPNVPPRHERPQTQSNLQPAGNVANEVINNKFENLMPQKKESFF